MDYFEIKLQSSCEDELKKRVADNKKRGFWVARYYEYEIEGSRTSNTKYKSAAGVHKRLKVSSVQRVYGAVMRRKNRDRTA